MWISLLSCGSCIIILEPVFISLYSHTYTYILYGHKFYSGLEWYATQFNITYGI